MSTKFFFLLAGAAMLYSCSKVECEPAVLPEEPAASQTVKIRISNEGDDATKAYYYEDSDYWTYLWEDQDYFHYFYYSHAGLQGSRFTQVSKDRESTYLSYEASDLDIGNTIYSYFIQKDMHGSVMSNNDPSAINMVIPTYQVTDLERETFHATIDPSFTIVDFQLDKISDSGSSAVPSRVVSFKIDGFNPEFNYTCGLVGTSGGFSDFFYDENGNASVTVTFDDSAILNFSSTTKIRIYNADYEENYDSLNIKVDRSPFTTSYTYSVTKGATSSESATVVTYGDVKPYPIRDAMPCASKGKLVTSLLLQYPEDIANSMTMYMLGSAAEFRIYSATGRYTGEQIEKCIFTSTNAPCAGQCTYDLTGESLVLEGYNEYSVVSDVSAANYFVPTEKMAEESVYMILAPGTYDAQFKVITKDAEGREWQYAYSLTNKAFTRANRKPFGVNLESTSATRTEYVDPVEHGSESGEEGM